MANAQADAASIRGTVTKAGGAAVVGGAVAAYDEYGTFVNSTITGTSGNYALGLSPGMYYLHARGGSSNSFLVTVSYDGNAGTVDFYASHGRLGELQPVTLGDADVTGIDFQLLTVGGKVTGKVYAADAVTAVSGATVQLCDEAGLLVDTTAAPTDAAGNFTLSGVPAGTYVLDAFPPADSYHVAATYHTPYSLGYGVWYADNLANATRITVTANMTRASTNFQLPAGGKICGDVTSGGPGLSGIVVTAYDAYGHAAGSAGSTFSGAYSVGAVLPGTFYLDARGYSANPTYITVAYDGLPWTVNYYWNRGRAGELTPVSVTAGQCTPNINFAMTDGGGGVEGTVANAYSGDPISSAPVTLFDEYGGFVDGMQTRIDGTYGFYGLEPGEYIAQADGPGGQCYTAVTYDGLPGSIWHDGNLAAATRISVPEYGILGATDFALSLGGVISGKVTAADGTTPIANARVTAYQTDGLHLVSTQTAPDGTYSLCVGANLCLLEAWGPDDSYYTQQIWQGLSGNLYTCNNMSNATPIWLYPGIVVEDVNFQLALGGKIKGIVTRSGGEGVNALVQVFEQATGCHVLGTGTRNDAPHVGEYAVAVAPGTYYVNARTDQDWNPPDTCLLAPVTYDGHVGLFDYLYGCGQQAGGLDAIVVQVSQDSTANFSLPPGGSVSGKVTEVDGVTPIAGAQVTLYDEDGCSVAAKQTAQDGTYKLCGLAPGTYVLEVRAPSGSCYESVTYNGLPGDIWHDDNLANGERIVIAPNTDFLVSDIHLPIGGLIAGKVTEEDGSTPIADAEVQVYRSDGAYVTTVRSMADATYTASCLSAGDYVLVAAGPYGTCYRVQTYQNLAGPIDFNDNLANATRVTVTAGAATPNIDFALPPGWVVAGKVTAPDGVTPVAYAQVRAYDTNGNIIGLAATFADGTYSFCVGHGTGDYVFDAIGSQDACYTAVTYNGLPGDINYDDNLVNATRVHVVAGSTVPGINFQLLPGATITGKVTEVDGTTSIANATVNAYRPGTNTQWVGGAATQPDGSYTLCLEPGEYILEARGPQVPCHAVVTYNGLAGGIWSGDNRTKATRITLAPGATVPDKNFQLPRGGTITGSITQQDGTTPIANAYVSICTLAGSYAANASVQSNGTYSVCLPAGEYLAYACPSGGASYQCETYNGLPGTLWCGSNCADATPIPVTSGGTTSGINFALDPLPTLDLTLRDPPQPSGTCWTAGSVLTVDWQTTATEGNVYLTLVQNGQSRCYSESVPVSTGTYTWTLPVTIGDGTYTAQATLTSSCGGTGSVVAAVAFCVSGSNPPVVQITEPAAGASLAAGSSQTVRWTVTNPVGSVDVTLQRPGSMAVPCSLGSTTMAAGQLAWTVPSYLGDATDYRITLTTIDGLCVTDAAQSAAFAITGTLPTPTLDITRPLPGECVQAGSVQTIQWTVPAGLEGTVTATLKRGANTVCSNVGSAFLSAGQMSWQVPLYAVDATDYVIDLAVALDDCGNAPHGVSQPFCITGSRQPPVLQITAPMSNDVIAAGSTFDITWEVPPDPAGYVLIMLGNPQARCAGPGGCGLAVVPIADGKYSWVVSKFFESRTDYAIGLCLYDSCTGYSGSGCVASNTFSITGGSPPAPTISVTAPLGNQTWYRGTRQCVTWSASHPTPAALQGVNVRVLLASPRNTLETLIVVGTAPILDGQLCFTVGADTPEAADYLVAVTLEGDLCTPAVATGSVAISHWPPDLDLDGDVDLGDFMKFQDCFNGPNRPPKSKCIRPADADLDNDADVDLADFMDFQDCFNGPNRPVKSKCLAP